MHLCYIGHCPLYTLCEPAHTQHRRSRPTLSSAMRNKILPAAGQGCRDLGEFDENWSGWRLTGGELFDAHSSAVTGFKPAEVRVLPILRQQISALEVELRLRPARRVSPSHRLTQLEALQGAIAQIEAEIAERGTQDELAVLRLLRGFPATPRTVTPSTATTTNNREYPPHETSSLHRRRATDHTG